MLFIFLDGVGIGETSNHNPFYVSNARYLPFYKGGLLLPDGTPVQAVDACLGVAGIPQSATGQTTLFTGINAPMLSGEHKGSYPNQSQRKIIYEFNILKRLLALGLSPFFINAYPIGFDFFTQEHVQILSDGSFHFSHQFPINYRRRLSVTTCMMIACQLKPFGASDIAAERSIYQEYSNLSLNRTLLQAQLAQFPGLTGKEKPLPEFSPEKAGEILAKSSRNYDFALYEYFQTDLYGHRHSFEERVELVKRLDRFIASVLAGLDPGSDTLVITSDHGNLEDGTSPAHTLNPVPLIVWGKESEKIRKRIRNLSDVTPVVVDFFKDSFEESF